MFAVAVLDGLCWLEKLPRGAGVECFCGECAKRLRAKDNRSYQVQDSLLIGKGQGSQTNTWKVGVAYFYLYCCKGKVC